MEGAVTEKSVLFVFFPKFILKRNFVIVSLYIKGINVIFYVTLVFDSVSNEYMNQLIYISNSNA